MFVVHEEAPKSIPISDSEKVKMGTVANLLYLLVLKFLALQKHPTFLKIR